MSANLVSDLYHSVKWNQVRDAALARDQGRCLVARLLGGECSDVLHAHHIVSADDRPDLFFDLDNVGTACEKHHPKWEALRRAILRVRGWRTCPHRHTTREGRRQCEARLNSELAEPSELVAA